MSAVCLNRKKKKVLITLNNVRLSGIEKFALLLSKYIDKSKYDVIIGIPGKGSLCDLFDANNIKYFVFNKNTNKPYSLRGIFNLFRFMVKIKFDIVHAQAGIAPCIIGKLLGTKLVMEHKHGLDFTDEFINNMSKFKLLYEKSKKLFTDYTVTVCLKDKNILINKFNYNADKIIVLYNGIEISYEEVIKANSKVIIGTIGRLTYQKAQEFFIDMAKILSEKGYNFEFHVYGDGENNKWYKDIISKYGLSDRILMKGYSKNVVSTLNTFSIFVLSSRYEGIPYVILEAMERKVPIVSTNVGGINEVIKSGKNGILVEKENSAQLAEAVIELISNDIQRTELVNQAYKDFENNYKIETTISNLEKIYSLID